MTSEKLLTKITFFEYITRKTSSLARNILQGIPARYEKPRKVCVSLSTDTDGIKCKQILIAATRKKLDVGRSWMSEEVEESDPHTVSC